MRILVNITLDEFSSASLHVSNNGPDYGNLMINSFMGT